MTAGESEVDEHRLFALAHDDVRRLEIEMRDADAVHRFEAGEHAVEKREGAARRDLTAREQRLEGHAIHELHDENGFGPSSEIEGDEAGGASSRRKARRFGGGDARVARVVETKRRHSRTVHTGNERWRESEVRPGDCGPRFFRSLTRNERTLWRLLHYMPSQLYFPTSCTKRTGAILSPSSFSP